MLGLRFCARAFSSCGEREPLFITMRGPLTVAASLVAEHKLQTCSRLSSCGSRAQLLHGMWDLPRLGIEPVSPALAGRFSTTAPPGKPKLYILYRSMVNWLLSLALASVNEEQNQKMLLHYICILYSIFNNFLVKPSILHLRKVTIIFIFIRSSDLLEMQGSLVLC